MFTGSSPAYSLRMVFSGNTPGCASVWGLSPSPIDRPESGQGRAALNPLITEDISMKKGRCRLCVRTDGLNLPAKLSADVPI